LMLSGFSAFIIRRATRLSMPAGDGRRPSYLTLFTPVMHAGSDAAASDEPARTPTENSITSSLESI
jgi:hypothetical protein